MFSLLRNMVFISKLPVPGTRNIMNNSIKDVESNRIVWMDLEMTGLDIEKDKIMEVACVVTDCDLNIVAEGPNVIIKQSDEILAAMNEWCINQHGKTGLTEACRKSNITELAAEDMLLDFLKKHTTEKCSPLAGNSVYMDRIFLQKFMPRLNNYLHYRLIDVSTIKELCRRWNVDVYKSAPKKNFTHRGRDDILESISELAYYKNSFFNVNIPK